MLADVNSENPIGWHFPLEPSEQWDGFNDRGISFFLGNPFVHLGREINQNAIDASDGDAVVIVKFRLIKIDTSSIPNLHELKNAVKLCCENAEGEGRKAEIFFENALASLEKSSINVLQISDYNTQGMKGPCVLGTPFYAFMKATGQSKKTSETASGSYGIGKFAPYAVSSLRTIFVSTVFQDSDGEWQQLTQGKSIFISHREGEELRRGIGFFGVKDKCRPIEGISESLPPWLQRTSIKSSDLPNQKGTTLSILGFDDVENWQELLSASVAENFFGAISNGKLSVDINDTFHLNESTIHEFFNNEDVKNKISLQSNEPENFENCKNYLLALNGDEGAFPNESQMTHLGRCELKVLVGENLPKKVCILRNGMFITDYLHRLKKFNDFKDFVAVFQCLNPTGNSLLREMEPPKHDGFEPSILPLKEEQKTGRKALDDLANWVREMLKRHAKDEPSEVTSIDELKDFFGEEGDEGEGSGSEEINPFGDVIIRAKPIKISFKNTSDNNGGNTGEEENGEGGGGAEGQGGQGGRGGKGRSEGGHGGGGGTMNSVKLNNIRAVLKNEKTRRISYTPMSSGKIAINVLAVGADFDADLKIVGSNSGKVDNGRVILEVQEGKRYSHDIKLNRKFNGSLKVLANEI